MSIVRFVAIVSVLCAVAHAGAGAECVPPDPAGPRTLILALDGVPYHAMQTAREMGAFAGWPPTRPLISTFPSMTNVGFAAILSPFGAKPVPGYEVRRYDPEFNTVGGGGAFSLKFEWRKQFQVQLGGFWNKAGLYMKPKQSAKSEFTHVEEFVNGTPDELMMALISSTDSLTHFHGSRGIVPLLVEFSQRIEEMRRNHEALYGRPLRLVMLSDHGNVEAKIHRRPAVKRVLKRAGLHPANKLEGPDDVVAVTYGIVSYGVLYLDPSNAEKAALAMLDIPGVHLAAWRSDEQEVRMVSQDAEARIRWRTSPTRRFFSYEADAGDPLRLIPVQADMARAGLLDADGFASREDWFDWTAYSEFPDAPVRLVDSLAGVWVSNAATVIFSFEPGYAWGTKPVHLASWFKALDATHGGLDRRSTSGFFLVSDPQFQFDRPVRAEQALVGWAEMSKCATASLIRFDDGHDRLHAPHSVAR